MRIPIFKESSKKFSRNDFKELPTGWITFPDFDKKDIFLGLKIGELKDGNIYIGFLCGRTNGFTTQEDFDECMNRMTMIAGKTHKALKLKKGKQKVYLNYPIDEFLMTGLPKGWKNHFKDAIQKAEQSKLNYIG